MSYKHVNKKGVTFYLHTCLNKWGTANLYYFSKTQNCNEHKMIDIPEGMEVIEGQRSSLPCIRKKKQ